MQVFTLSDVQWAIPELLDDKGEPIDLHTLASISGDPTGREGWMTIAADDGKVYIARFRCEGRWFEWADNPAWNVVSVEEKDGETYYHCERASGSGTVAGTFW